MFRSVLIQVFSTVKFTQFTTLGPKVSPGMADVMLMEELGSAIMLREECSIGFGCPLGYFQEVTTWLELCSYRCSPG